MGLPGDLLYKASQARTSARMLLDAGDADGACSRAYFGLFLMARAALIASGGTTGNEVSVDKDRVIRALRPLVDESFWKSLFGAWIKAEGLQLLADYGRQPVSSEDVRALLEQIDALSPSLLDLVPIRQQASAETKLVLGFGDSAVGHLKRARIGTCHEAFQPILVWGPLPQGDAYFAPRPAPTQAERNALVFTDFHWFQHSTATRAASCNVWPGLRELAAQYDRVELWADPDPNSQLALVFLLDYLGDNGAILEKIRLYQSSMRLGGSPAEASLISVPPLTPVEPAAAAVASRVWRAYAAPTPEGMPSLLESDLGCFPFLHSAIVELLEELPGVDDGLGATQRSLLRMLADGAAETPRDVFSNHEKRPPTFSYWQLGAILDDLCRCRQPAISGLSEGPFTLEMHDDRDRHKRYAESRLILTDFGRALLEGQADFAKENKVERWWGGTALRNDALWRWDRNHRILVAD